jgi:hypothetical protein
MVPMRYDSVRGVKRPAVDLTPARAYGDAIVMIPEALAANVSEMFDIQPLVDIMEKVLLDSEPDDLIVAVGDPVIIAAAASIQSDIHGKVKMLRWERQEQRYKIMEYVIWT